MPHALKRWLLGPIMYPLGILMWLVYVTLKFVILNPPWLPSCCKGVTRINERIPFPDGCLEVAAAGTSA